MNSASRARIGVIGAGHWASSFYLPWLHGHPEVDLVGIVRKPGEDLKSLKSAFELAIATSSLDELLQAELDGVIVSSPHVLHCDHAISALEAGLHVLVEKPMALTVSEADAMLAAAARAGKLLTVAHGWNYFRQVEWAMRQLELGVLGQITSVVGYMASGVAPLLSGRRGALRTTVGGVTVEARAETWATAGSGGGFLFGQLSHLLGLAFLMLPEDPVEVFSRAQLLPNGVDIDIHISTTFTGGAVGSFCGHGRQPPGRPQGFEIRIVGEHGSLHLDFERPRAIIDVVGRRGTTHTREIDPPLASRDGQYSCDGPPAALVAACLGRTFDDRAPAIVGLRSVALMEAASNSYRLRRPFKIAARPAAPCADNQRCL